MALGYLTVKILIFIVVVMLVAPVSIDCLQTKLVNKKTTRSVLGKYLRGHVFKTTYHSQDPQHCLSDCWQEDELCESFNYLPDLDICELNDRSKENALEDYVDRDRSVYLTNPRFGKAKIIHMPRHTLHQTQQVFNACTSNPCVNGGKCSADIATGFRCTDCDEGYYGLLCEQEIDPCQLANPCQNDGKCLKAPGEPFRCECSFPTSGDYCETISQNYEFVISKTSGSPILQIEEGEKRNTVVLWFWFRTAQVFTYFFSIVPDSSQSVTAAMWKNGSTIFVRFWKDLVQEFSFPYSYNISDNTWHSVVLMCDQSFLNVYLDGVVRETKQYNITGKIEIPKGNLHLGYYKERTGEEYRFEGAISPIDYKYHLSETFSVQRKISHDCSLTSAEGQWHGLYWTGFLLAQPISPCVNRVPPNGLQSRLLMVTIQRRWLVHDVSSPRDLEAFTLSFWMQSFTFPVEHDYQIACYGYSGNCSLTVTIQVNLRLKIEIKSSIVWMDTLPIIDENVRHVVITWTNLGGILEVIIDGILQSSFKNIETNSVIPGKNKFIAGGSDVAMINYDGFLFEMNMWDHLLPVNLLYLMALHKGNDRGNVVSWKSFKQSSDLTSLFGKTSSNMASVVGNTHFCMVFNSINPENYASQVVSTKISSFPEITIIVWFQIESFPGTLMTYQSLRSSSEIALRIQHDGAVAFSLYNSSTTLKNLSDIHIGPWHYLAVTWNINGSLFMNFDMSENDVSKNFNINNEIQVDGQEWFMAEKSQGFVGKIGRLYVWDKAVPSSVLRAMAKGGNTFDISVNTPQANKYEAFGDVQNIKGNEIQSVCYPVQKRRDEYCNTIEEGRENCTYSARLGAGSTTVNTSGGHVTKSGMFMGCYCYETLTEDKNVNISSIGNFTHSESLFIIT